MGPGLAGWRLERRAPATSVLTTIGLICRDDAVRLL
jgi:hypothetical protein